MQIEEKREIKISNNSLSKEPDLSSGGRGMLVKKQFLFLSFRDFIDRL